MWTPSRHLRKRAKRAKLLESLYLLCTLFEFRSDIFKALRSIAFITLSGLRFSISQIARTTLLRFKSSDKHRVLPGEVQESFSLFCMSAGNLITMDGMRRWVWTGEHVGCSYGDGVGW